MTTQTKHSCPPHLRKYVLFTAILASALGFIDGTVVAIAIPQIRASLNATFAQMQWVSNAYVLFLAALMLIGGAAGDRYGLKRTFGVGIVIFVASSLICAVAPTAQSLVVFRAFQGMGAAIMVPGSMAIVSQNYPRAERGKALGLWVAASSITAALGPLAGGFLLSLGDDEMWRWIFAINLPLGGLTLFILWWKVPFDRPAKKRKLDWVGAVLTTASLGAIAAGLTFLGEGDAGLGVWVSIALLVVGSLVLVLAIVWELKIPHPMIDLGLFRSREFTGANVLTLLVWLGLGAVFFFLPMVLITGWKLPEIYAGGIFLPFSVIIATLSPFIGRLVDKTGPRLFLSIGPVVAAVGFVALAYALIEQNYWYGIVPSIAIVGLAFGLMASSLSTAVMVSVDDESAGSASGINNMIARMSSLFAVAGLGGVVTFVYRSVIRGSELPEDIQRSMVEAGFGERLTGGLYQISLVELQNTAMNQALAVLCLVIAGFCLAGAVVGWLTQVDHKADRLSQS